MSYIIKYVVMIISKYHGAFPFSVIFKLPIVFLLMYMYLYGGGRATLKLLVNLLINFKNIVYMYI